MEEKLEIIELRPISPKRIMVVAVAIAFAFLVIFFGYRAYSLVSNVVVGSSGSASPLLSGSSRIAKDLARLAPEDRRINILLLGSGGGYHPGGELTDTILVASIDVKNDSVAMISLPRDLYIPVQGFGRQKLNSVFVLGKENGDDDGDGYRLMKDTVSSALGVPIHYFIHVDFQGFEEIIDNLGGVDIEVAEDLYDPLFPDEDLLGYEEFFVQAGWRHFNGENALKYARSRHTTSDFDRARRQQEIVAAVKNELIKTENILNVKKITQILTTLSEHVKTDLQIGEIEALARIASNIDSSKITSRVIDDGSQGLAYADNYYGMYVLVLYDEDFSALHRYVDFYFQDPFLVAEQARVAVLNGTTTIGIAGSVANDLSQSVFEVVEVANTPDRERYDKTIIYDYSAGTKKASLHFLSTLFDAEIKTVHVSQGDESDRDIEIIIGEDYVQKNN